MADSPEGIARVRELQNRSIGSKTTFTRKFARGAKHSHRVTRLYRCGRNWGCTSLRQKNPAVAAAGHVTRTFFRAVSPETLVSRRDYSQRYRVSTIFEPHPLRRNPRSAKGNR